MAEAVKASQYLVSYFHSEGKGRAFATLARGGLPSEDDIRRWEGNIERRMTLRQVGIKSFQLLDSQEADR